MTFPWEGFLSNGEFLDLLLNFFTSTTKGLFGSKINRSALDPFDKVPWFKFKISAGFFVSFLITSNKLKVLLW